MATLRLKTDLRCEACVAAIRPALDAEPGLTRWTADVSIPDKTLTVEGDRVTAARVSELLRPHGYRVLGELPAEASVAAPTEPPTSYFPLLLTLLYLLGVCGAVEVAAGGFDPMRAMTHFMAGFFLVFSFFKLLNLTAFADAYAGYDLVAARWRGYGFAYPFIELGLGLSYLLHLHPMAVNAVTLVVMLVSTAGVVKALLARRKIQCACLGAVFNLPMSTVTLVEDLLMVSMAAGMLVVGM